LITEGRYAEAYMVNWQANVFPGILDGDAIGRASPLAAASALKAKAVAICRLSAPRLTTKAIYDRAAAFAALKADEGFSVGVLFRDNRAGRTTPKTSASTSLLPEIESQIQVCC